MAIDQVTGEHLLAHIAADLEGLPFPSTKDQIMDYIIRFGKCENKNEDLEALAHLQDRVYESPTQVMAEIGALIPD